MTTGTWPEAELDGNPAARYAQSLALRLREAIGTRSLRSVARDAGIADMTIKGILDGQNFADLRTIASLESALRCSLIPAWRERRTWTQPRLPLIAEIPESG